MGLLQVLVEQRKFRSQLRKGKCAIRGHASRHSQCALSSTHCPACLNHAPRHSSRLLLFPQHIKLIL
jgi:hypothetical protein